VVVPQFSLLIQCGHSQSKDDQQEENITRVHGTYDLSLAQTYY
jgi:hypothetical protein